MRGDELLPVLRRVLSTRTYELVERFFWKKNKFTKARVRAIIRAALALVLGRTLVCHQCHKPVAKVLVRVRKGQLELWGIRASAVRVDFADRDNIRFAHAYPSDCRPK